MQINSNLYHYGTAYTSVQKKTQKESGGYDWDSLLSGNKTVDIHPEAQARMQRDSEFAEYVISHLEEWFDSEEQREKSKMQLGLGISLERMIVGADGRIVYEQAPGPNIKPFESDSEDDESDFWKKRIEQYEYNMKLWQEKQMKDQRVKKSILLSCKK